MENKNYRLITVALKQFGRGIRFEAEVDGKRGAYTVAEHTNIGSGWLMRNTDSGAIVSCQELTNLSPKASMRQHFWRLVSTFSNK